MFLSKMKARIKDFLFASFNRTINYVYTSVIIFLVLITGSSALFIANMQIEENTSQNINDTVSQTRQYLDFVLTDVFQQLVLLANDPKMYRLLLSDDGVPPKYYIETDRELENLYYRYTHIIESILIDINSGTYTFYVSPQSKVNPNYQYEDFFQYYKGNRENYYWQNIHNNVFFLDHENVFSVFKLFGTENSQVQGIILFNLKESFFEDVLNNTFISDNGYLALISPDGYYLSKDVDEKFQLSADNFKEVRSYDGNGETVTVTNSAGEELIVISQEIGINKWQVAAVIPKEDMFSKIDYIKVFILFMVLLIIILGILLVNFIGKFMSKPIHRLANYMASAGSPRYGFAHPENVPKEMEILYTSFNELMNRNYQLLHEIKREQEERKNLEIAVLQAQINPHFLYNTLYSIKGLCDMGMAEEASDMVSALSNFFRISISRGNEVISIEEEVNHIQSYLYIMEMRYGDNFSYDMDVEEDILTYPILKLTLQPLVENAIYHGVKKKHGKGVIRVNGYGKEDRIVLEVIDNGPGIDEEKLTEIQRELALGTNRRRDKQITGIGLKSVNVRIKGYFGEQYGLTIESESGKGTKVTVTIPKQKEGIDNHA